MEADLIIQVPKASPVTSKRILGQLRPGVSNCSPPTILKRTAADWLNTVSQLPVPSNQQYVDMYGREGKAGKRAGFGPCGAEFDTPGLDSCFYLYL